MQHRIAKKNRKISVKSVNNCNSYSDFSAGTQKMEVSTIGNGTGNLLLNCVSEEISNNKPAKSVRNVLHMLEDANATV